MESAHKATPAQLLHQVVTRRVSRQAEGRLQPARAELHPAKAPEKLVPGKRAAKGVFGQRRGPFGTSRRSVRCETVCMFHCWGGGELVQQKSYIKSYTNWSDVFTRGKWNKGIFCSPEDGMYLQLDSMCKGCIQGRIGRRGSHQKKRHSSMKHSVVWICTLTLDLVSPKRCQQKNYNK